VVLTALPCTTLAADGEEGEDDEAVDGAGVGVAAGCAVSTVPVDGW
jgi:hypothetical protein